MRLPSPSPSPAGSKPRQRGIALILVLGAIIALTAIVAGFTYSMKVEARLAQNYESDAEMLWMARSGVELARYVLAQELQTPEGRMFDALNQKWAGGVGSITNDILAGISLTDNTLGRGRFSLKITDQERRFNINAADRNVLEHALGLMNVEVSAHGTIIDSILDWRDTDNDPQINGAESDDFYLRLDPPYFAKNGPIDDLSELLLIKGMTPEVFWGSGSTNVPSEDLEPLSRVDRLRQRDKPFITFGFNDVFTTISAPQVNINTCTAETLQLSGVDPLTVSLIMETRRGPDGVEGTEDDMPFRSPAQIPVPGEDPTIRQALQMYFTVRSRTFEVIVTCDIGGYTRQYRAMLLRNSQRDIQVLFLHAI